MLLSGLLVKSHAQFTQLDLGINGLTCSQCSRSVDMQLRKLAFVQGVQMDLKHTQAIIQLKKEERVNIAAVAKAVEDAGFSVRYLKAKVQPGFFVKETKQDCWTVGEDAYVLLQSRDAGQVASLQFVGKEYMPRQEFKVY